MYSDAKPGTRGRVASCDRSKRKCNSGNGSALRRHCNNIENDLDNVDLCFVSVCVIWEAGGESISISEFFERFVYIPKSTEEPPNKRENTLGDTRGRTVERRHSVDGKRTRVARILGTKLRQRQE